jgi:hypothetical protein
MKGTVADELRYLQYKLEGCAVLALAAVMRAALLFSPLLRSARVGQPTTREQGRGPEVRDINDDPCDPPQKGAHEKGVCRERDPGVVRTSH